MQTIRDINRLQAPFRARVERWLNDVLAECNSATGVLSGLEFIILETLRPFERQEALYAQGRTAPGPIVTNALPGSSFHQYGLALDGGIKYKGKPFSWSWPNDPKLWAGMKRIAELAKRHGIAWGGEWIKFRDLPHFQASDAPSISVCRQKWPKGWKG